MPVLELEDAPLIETKLAPPRVRPNILLRPRLLESLERSAPAALTLVVAPVGFGKSILVQSWCAAQSGAAIAWLSLDSADDDPARLWTYFATAVDRIRPGLGRPALKRLRSSAVSIPSAIDELANALSGYGRPAVIVIDDLHLVTDSDTLASLEYAVERLPASARIIATTRVDPPLRLGRMRAGGTLAEIRSGELAFTAAEAHELLVEREGIELPEEAVEQLVERTEGWPAGLYLAALWLRGLDDPRARVREFAGDHRHVADYLTGEVLDTLPAEQRAFLLRTSVLQRFTASLCDAVLGRADSAEMLAEIERSNLFLVTLDPRGQWYRYHHLFAQLLQLELEHSDPPAAAALRRSAATWFRERELIADAIEHAAAAGDDRTVADLLYDYGGTLLRSGRAATLLRWVERLPEQYLDSPELILSAALAAGLLGRPEAQRHRYVALAERMRSERPAVWGSYSEAAYWVTRAAWMDGDVGAAVENGRTAVAATAGTAIELPAMAGLAYALLLAGDQGGAREQAERAIRIPEAEQRPIGFVEALAVLSIVEADEGHADVAETRAREALEFGCAAGIDESWIGGLARIGLARALAVAGELREAESAAERGERLRRAVEPTVENVHALLVLADIRVGRGRLSQARADLEEAAGALAAFADVGALPALARRVEAALTEAEATQMAHPLEEAPTPAELAVLQLLPSGLSQREIGAQLFLSLNTVKTHTRELYRKLGAGSRQEAVIRAAALGLLDQGQSPG